MHLTDLLHSYGYAFVFVIVALESLGVPMPGETALLAAAALAAAGHLNIAIVIATAAAGAIVGDAIGYWIGRKGGIALIRRHGHLLRLTDARVARVNAYFVRHGAKTVFFGRFIALLRTFAALFAGIGQMPYAEFTVYNATGGIVWACAIGGLGYLFGRRLQHLENVIGDASWILAAVLAAGVIAIWIWRRRKASRSSTPDVLLTHRPPGSDGDHQ